MQRALVFGASAIIILTLNPRILKEVSCSLMQCFPLREWSFHHLICCDYLWLSILLCFQFEGKQMFSCPVIIVEALENVTNFVSILKRYVIWYIWIWYCSSIFFFLFYMYTIYDIIYIIFQQNENEGKDISGSKDICKWYCHEWLSVRWIIKKYGT